MLSDEHASSVKHNPDSENTSDISFISNLFKRKPINALPILSDLIKIKGNSHLFDVYDKN